MHQTTSKNGDLGTSASSNEWTVPDNIRVLTPHEMRQQMAAAAMPVKDAKSVSKRVPAMSLLPHRPYVESSRGGGDRELN